MATLSPLNTQEDRSQCLIRRACIEEDKLILFLSTLLDEDLAPLADDFALRCKAKKISVQAVTMDSSEGQTVLAFLLEQPLTMHDALSVSYRPSLWLMSSKAGGEAVAPFEETIYLSASDNLDARIRLRLAFDNDTCEPSPPSTESDCVPVLANARDFQAQINFGRALDMTSLPGVEQFRAELEDRWLKVTSVRFSRTDVDGNTALILSLSESLQPGVVLTVSYRSPRRELKTIDGEVVSAFSVATEVEERLVVIRRSGSSLHDELERNWTRKVTPTPEESALETTMDELLEDVDAISQWCSEEDWSPTTEGAYTQDAEPEENSDVAKLSLHTTSGSDSNSSQPLHPIENSAPLQQRFAPLSVLKAQVIASSPLTRLIYLVPAVVLLWLLVVAAIYLFTFTFNDRGISGAAPAVSESGLRQECTIVSPEGGRYQGQCLNGERDGYGVFRWASGNRYEGYWQRGQRHGKGRLSYVSGAEYQGDYEAGKEQGYGIMRWPNGASYEGEYLAGRFHGEGVYVSASGSRFQGRFEHGSMTGDGECQMRDGSKLRGPCR